MNSKMMMLLFGAAGVVGLPLIFMFFMLFIFAPFGGDAGGDQTCNITTDVSNSDSGTSKDTGKDGKAPAGFDLPRPDGPGEQNKDAGPIPSNFLKAYKDAGKKYGLPWQLLAGVGEDESGHHAGSVSSVGAQGPMQFMPPTWATYGVDGNGDGVKNAWDIGDAAFGAANYLVALGVKNGPEGVFGALGKYNGSYPSHVYANDVLKYAWEYATGKVIVVPGGGGGDCSTVDASTVGGKIVQYAEKWLGTPYQFAGGDEHGPTVGVDSRGDGALGFDCSGLVLYSVYNATGGKVDLPHNAALQYEDHRVKPVPMNQLQPGDLVFLDDLEHIGIYVGHQKIIDAPHTGAYVRYDSLAPGSDFYENFVGGGRILGSGDDKS